MRSTIDLHLRLAQRGSAKYEATLPLPEPEDPDQLMAVMVFGDMVGGQFHIHEVVRRYNGEVVPESTWRPLEQDLLGQVPKEPGKDRWDIPGALIDEPDGYPVGGHGGTNADA